MDFELYKKVPHLVSAWERNDSKVDGYIYGQVRKFEKLKLMDRAISTLVITMCIASGIAAIVYYQPDKVWISALYFITVCALVATGQTLDLNKNPSFKKTLENLQRFHNPFYVLYDPKEGLSSLSV